MELKNKIRRRLNNRLLRYSYNIKLSRTIAPMPNSLDIEITNRCNLKCPGCPRGEMGRSLGDMSLDLYKKIIEDSHPYVYFAWLHLFGEPLLNSNVSEMIGYASKRGISCGISTNGTVLNEKLAKNLCLSGLDTIIISIDATTNRTYKKIRTGGNFKKLTENIEMFLNLPERQNINNTILQMVKMDNNRHEIEEFIKKWKGSDRSVHIKEEDSWAGHFKNKAQLYPLERFPCRKLWERLTIDWQGNVSICCKDFRIQVNLGNIKNKSLNKIWNGQKMISLRKSLVKNELDKIPLCKSCNEWVFSDPRFKNFRSY